eukprot:15359755-Ditylum_brightwellii.AAC.1
MALPSNAHDNEDTKNDKDTDNEPITTTTADNEDCNKPDDVSITSHQPPMQQYKMNVNLCIPYIATLEQFNIFQV